LEDEENCNEVNPSPAYENKKFVKYYKSVSGHYTERVTASVNYAKYLEGESHAAEREEADAAWYRNEERIKRENKEREEREEIKEHNKKVKEREAWDMDHYGERMPEYLKDDPQGCVVA
jgi:hypothetical protein